MMLNVYFFPFIRLFLIHAAAMLAGMKIRSTAVPFDAWQAGTELVVWVSWRVAAPGPMQGQGTDVEEEEMQDTAGPVWDMRYSLDPREMESGMNTRQAALEGEKQKKIRRIVSFYFHYYCYISS